MQCALAVAMLAFLVLQPPAVGAMLVIPIGGASQATLLNVATRQGGAVLGGGAIGGSLVIFGERAKLLPALLNAHALVVAAPASICGDLPVGREQGARA